MDNGKVIEDWMLATHDTICCLQTWLAQLAHWRATGQAEPLDFETACRQLQEARLWDWASDAGGHGIEALARAVEATKEYVR
jgi:hypothetical protein